MIFEGKPSVVGHRGYGAGEPGGYRENSVESFLAAADNGVPWVELDVRRSSDGELMLWHDPFTPAGDVIVATTAADLAADGIVTLDAVLSVLPAHVGVNIDVKTVLADATDPQARRTYALVAAALLKYSETRQFLVSSFDPALPMYLKNMGDQLGDVALGLILLENFPANHGIPAAANLGLDAVVLHMETLRRSRDRTRAGDLSVEQVMGAAHQAGLEVMTWGANPAEAAALGRAGADALCVNDIPGVQAALSAAAAG